MVGGRRTIPFSPFVKITRSSADFFGIRTVSPALDLLLVCGIFHRNRRDAESAQVYDAPGILIEPGKIPGAFSPLSPCPTHKFPALRPDRLTCPLLRP